MRLRRVAMILLAVGLLFSTTAPVGADAARKAPPGFKTVKVKKAGFSIAIPKAWEVINVTRKDVEGIIETLRDVAPDLADKVPDISTLKAQNIVFLGYSDETVDGFTANVNVLLIPGVTNPPTIDDIRPSVEAIAPDADFSDTTVDGEGAVKAEYDLAVGTLRPQLVQYAVTGSRGGLAFTFTSVPGGLSDDDFDTMVDSIRLLAR